MFLDGKLRIFGVHYRTPFEAGWSSSPAAAAAAVRSRSAASARTPASASSDTPAYALGGTRYLGAYDVSDSEGGPDAYYDVVDLRTRRSVAFLNAVCCTGVPSFRVAARRHARRRRPHRQAPAPAPAGAPNNGRDVALRGGTVYWTEGGAARSATLSGVAGDAEGRMLEPVSVHRRRGAVHLGEGHDDRGVAARARRAQGVRPALRLSRPFGATHPARQGHAARSSATAGCSPARA